MAKKKDNTKDGRFITSNTGEAAVVDTSPDAKERTALDAIKENKDEGKLFPADTGISEEDELMLKQNELIVKKREKEEMVRLAELDVKRTYESAQALFKNAADYLRNTIVPVHGDSEVLGSYSKVLEDWLAIFEEWSDGIPLGKDADWDIIQDRINDIKKETKRLNGEQLNVKKKEVESRKDELRKINDELSELEKSQT